MRKAAIAAFFVILADMNKDTIKIFYDGDCRVCDAEMSHYMKIARDSGIEYVNINDPDFDFSQYQISRDDFMAELHVLDQTGTFRVGVDAFRLIWSKLPGLHYHVLEVLTGLPGINLLSRIGYRLFAQNRHLLPKKSTKKGTA